MVAAVAPGLLRVQQGLEWQLLRGQEMQLQVRGHGHLQDTHQCSTCAVEPENIQTHGEANPCLVNIKTHSCGLCAR